MTSALNEDSPGSQENARILALAADLAYEPQETGVSKFQNQLGMQARLISVGNTQSWVASDKHNIIVAFRGTEAPNSLEGLKDWLLTDALSLLIVPEGRLGTDLAAAGVGARFHQGFVNAIADIWEPTRQAVEQELRAADRPLWITGHSLGGALALLAGWLFTRKMIAVCEIITFGAPMIGNQAAVDAFDREFAGKIFRYVNAPDPVPRLPMYSLMTNEFVHCQKECRLADASEDALAGLMQSLAKNAADKLLSATFVDEIWNAAKGSVASHGMEHYRRLLG
ncbi:MAG: lipase family protein [Planctomycetaceae bacterium]|jgi:predicted lipase